MPVPYSQVGKIAIVLGSICLLYAIVPLSKGDQGEMFGGYFGIRLLLALIAAVCILGGLILRSLGRIERALRERGAAPATSEQGSGDHASTRNADEAFQEKRS